ncbi:MAG: hypothetical protein H6672_19035 [Anaerolineaceae bacterium]|nr:hypothetical protein [Anaerolineaceae bacterium]
MAEIHVRPALLDDTQAISSLFRSRIPVWQRMDTIGEVQDVAYEQLTIYERWLHGGPWMSVETGALHLSHLLRGAGFPLVAIHEDKLAGYTEAFHSVEPAPFGNHLHLTSLVSNDPAVCKALAQHILKQAAVVDVQRVTASIIAHDDESVEFYRAFGMQPLTRIHRINLPAKTGQVFYKSVEHPNANPAQVHGWHMSLGRWECARQHWETLWPRTWAAIPEIQRRPTNRLYVTAAGQEAYVLIHQQLYAPRSAEVYCWTPKPLPGQVLTAIRDWGHREGYRTLVLAVTDATLKALGAEAEPDGYYQDIYAIDG